ncbi:hypothetical protein [Henriciella sp.]|uniref:hypothetical protein n=1 Tax=Henriciella sp. TaxID=1968823 RepID=UPI00117A2E76
MSSTSFMVKAAIAALFLWVQGAALFDAAAHGDQPHDHYGISCDLKAVAHDVAPLPLSPDLPEPPRFFGTTEQPVSDYRAWSRPPGRAPPPRSPPVFLQ